MLKDRKFDVSVLKDSVISGYCLISESVLDLNLKYFCVMNSDYLWKSMLQ